MEGHIFQAILFSSPNNPIIKMCIDSMLQYGSNIGIDPKDEPPYIGHPTKCMYDNIKLLNNNNDIHDGIHMINDQLVLLAEEKIINGRIMDVFLKDKLFSYSRYNNYDREKGFF